MKATGMESVGDYIPFPSDIPQLILWESLTFQGRKGNIILPTNSEATLGDWAHFSILSLKLCPAVSTSCTAEVLLMCWLKQGKSFLSIYFCLPGITEQAEWQERHLLQRCSTSCFHTYVPVWHCDYLLGGLSEVDRSELPALFHTWR